MKAGLGKTAVLKLPKKKRQRRPQMRPKKSWKIPVCQNFKPNTWLK